jgi:hypothetical protein
VILELRNNLNEGANSNGSANNDAPVVSFDDRSRANNRSALAFFESFDLLSDNVSNGSGIGIQNVAWGNIELVSSNAATSPLKVGFVGSGDGISSRSNPHGNGEVTFLGFQNQTTSGFDVDNGTDAELNPAKWIGNTDQVFSYFYAGFEKKDKNNPEHKQVQRNRSQEGSGAVDVKVETRNQGIDHNYCYSADKSGKGSVLEILHGLSLTEEEVG